MGDAIMHGMNVKKGCYYKGENRNGSPFIFYILDINTVIREITYRVIVDKDITRHKMPRGMIGIVTTKPWDCFLETKQIKKKDIIWEVL